MAFPFLTQEKKIEFGIYKVFLGGEEGLFNIFFSLWCSKLFSAPSELESILWMAEEARGKKKNHPCSINGIKLIKARGSHLILGYWVTPSDYCFCFTDSWDILDLEGFPGDSDSKESACNAGDPGLIPGSGRVPGGDHGNPLQYSCLQNSAESMGSQRGRHNWAASPFTLSTTLGSRQEMVILFCSRNHIKITFWGDWKEWGSTILDL